MNTARPEAGRDQGHLAQLAKLVDVTTGLRIKLCSLLKEGVGTNSVELEAKRWRLQEENALGGSSLSGGEAEEVHVEQVATTAAGEPDPGDSVPRNSRGRKGRIKGDKLKDVVRDQEKVRSLMGTRIEQIKRKEKEARMLYKQEKDKVRRDFQKRGREKQYRNVIERIARQSQSRWSKEKPHREKFVRHQVEKINREKERDRENNVQQEVREWRH